MNHAVKDIKLAAQGQLKIEWAESHMPVLAQIRARFAKEKPLKGVRIGACLHVTKETAVLVRTLIGGGAQVALCASNPLSTQDDVAAALAGEGIPVFAVKGESNDEYYSHLNSVLDLKPNITLDDGADLINTIHSKRKELLKDVFGGQEETTTGVIRLRAMAKAGALKYPVVAVNDTPTKHLFDNRYGTGQSTLDGVIRSTNLLIAGRTVVVAGYGWCGRGFALRARGMGARVIVTEIDPVKALEARMDGYEAMPMREAAKTGDVFVTATGCKDVLTAEHFALMPDGAVLANTGHFDCEINVPELEKAAKSSREIRPQVVEYLMKDGRKIHLLSAGRLVNLSAAEGHPSEVMDQSFSDQALVSEYLAKSRGKLAPGVHEVPKEIDDLVAKLKLKSWGIAIDVLTPAQKKYLDSWDEGT
ncbi:MAG: adenosylhomocysteinase [Candidatus Micrarchaeota archaeon]